MNTKARWWPLWVLCLVLTSAETRGQETLWEAYQSAGVKALQEGRSAEAERLLMAAIGRAEQFGKEDPRLAQTLNDLGVLYASQGKKVEAEPLFRRSLEIIRETIGPEHPNAVSPLRNLGILYATQGKFAEAEALLRQALAIDLATLGPDHPEVAVALRNLAGFYAAQGNYPEAERLVRKSLGIQEKVLGPEHVEVASSLEVFAALLRKTHRDEEAKELEARAHEIHAMQTQRNPVK